MNIIKGGKSILPTPHLQICSHEHEHVQSLCEDTSPSSPQLVTIWQQPVKTHKKNYFFFCSIFHAVTARRKYMDIYVCKAKQSIPALSISLGLSQDAATTLHHNWPSEHFGNLYETSILALRVYAQAWQFLLTVPTLINTMGQSSVPAPRLSLHSKHLPLHYSTGLRIPMETVPRSAAPDPCLALLGRGGLRATCQYGQSQDMTSAHALTLLVFLIAFEPLQFTLSSNMGRT